MKAGKLSPELQAIFDELPALIEYCERNGKEYAEHIIQQITEDADMAPHRREQIVISYLDKQIERYKELINSGLRLKATDKAGMLHMIGLHMYAANTWKIPLPKGCKFWSSEPNPKRHIHAAIAPLFNHFAAIQACKEMLTITDGTKPKGEGIAGIFDDKQLQKIFDRLSKSGYIAGKQSDFVSSFQHGALPSGWNKLTWKQNNTELSVLVYQITHHKPKPGEVNRIFNTNTKFSKMASQRHDVRGGKVYKMLQELSLI